MKPIVVGFDGSSSATDAVAWAAREASIRSRPLDIVHCWPFKAVGNGIYEYNKGVQREWAESATKLLYDAVEVAHRQEPGLEVRWQMIEHSAPDGLLSVAHAAEMLVLGSRGLGSYKQALLGSVSRAVTSRAVCPTVVVPHLSRTRNRVVVGVDGTELSMRAVEFAAREASIRGAELVAVHAYELAPVRSESGQYAEFVRWLEGEERRDVAESLTGWRVDHPDLEVSEVFARENPVSLLVEQSADADLVVVGSRGRGFTEMMLGSVAQALIRHSEAPVAVVRR